MSNQAILLLSLKTYFDRLSCGARIVLGRAAEKYSETTANWQVTVKLVISTAGFYIDIFSPLDIFASMSLARLEPVRQTYVDSRKTNRFTD